MNDGIDRPVQAAVDDRMWGSDVVADTLRALGIAYVALNPGASFRGLHDSLVNRLGNRAPQMLLCLHENAAVALAHGYAKASGRPMAAILHSNVGLLNGAMGVFNAWADRVPMLVIGATGPVDAAQRRPWIDWLHTMQDQGALLRGYVKWDAQPASAEAAVEALLRAAQIMDRAPRGPVYVNLDAAMQERLLARPVTVPDPARYAPPPPVAPNPALLERAAALLDGAVRPVMLIGRGTTAAGWPARVALAEALGAAVITDLKQPACFPTLHPLHTGAPGFTLAMAAEAALRAADVVLALDWVDLAGTLRAARATGQVIHVSPDQRSHNGFAMDHQALPPADLFFDNEPDAFVAALLPMLPPGPALPDRVTDAANYTALDTARLGAELRDALGARPAALLRVPLGWDAAAWPFAAPGDYLGYDGGGGIGSGPGMVVGAALAMRDAGDPRLPVAVTGDGDALMGLQALWTAARHRVPLLLVIANNQSFYNDEVHQERVARERGRPIANKGIGQSIRDPDPDLATLARGLGCIGIGPAIGLEAWRAALAEGVARVAAGETVVVDIRVLPGYTPSVTRVIDP